MRLKTWAALAAAALILPLLGACGNDDAQDGFVRNINATSEYTSLDLYKQASDGSDELVIGGTTANTASAYSGIRKGSYTFDVKSSTSAGAATPASGVITKSDHFSVVTYVTGTATKTQVLSDEETHPASGNAKVRVFNAATSEASSVDVYLSTNACNALTITDTPFASAVTGLQSAYSQVSASGSAGSTWNVCVFAAGDTGTLLLDIPTLTLKDQEIATLILTHTGGGVLLNALVLDQQGAMTAYTSQIARIRVAADAASAGQVSVTLNSVDLTSLATSPSINDYQTIPSGALTGTVTIDGVTTSGVSLTAAAGTDYTLLVTGSSGSPQVTLLPDNNTPSTSTSASVKARVINGVNGFSGSLSATVDNKSLGNVVLGAASAYTQIPSTTGTSTVQASVATNPSSLVNQSFNASGVYTVFVWGDASAPKLAVTQDR